MSIDRRIFLKTSTACASIIALPMAAWAQAPVRIGVMIPGSKSDSARQLAPALRNLLITRPR